MKNLSRIIFILLFFISTAWASDKKGIGLADLHATNRIKALNLAWYYTWKLNPIEDTNIDMFVPMIWGGSRTEKALSTLKKQGKVPILLGFNEPNKMDQGNMSVDIAIRIWPELEKMSEQLGSPAPAGVLTSWFDRFYRIATKKGFKLDFMAVHIYGPPNPTKFLAKIDKTYKKYQLPIWITEFAVADWDAKNKPGTNRFSETEVLEFMKVVLPELESRPYVKRYAWFGAGKHSLTHEQVRTSRLFEKSGKLTPLGEFYSKF